MLKSVKLFLKNFEVKTIIGVHDFEEEFEQRLLINIEMEINQNRPFFKDDINSTVDYDFLRKEISELVATNRYKTQESLCISILERVLSNDGIIKAKVVTEKIDIYPDAQSVGCEMCGTNDIQRINNE